MADAGLPDITDKVNRTGDRGRVLSPYLLSKIIACKVGRMHLSKLALAHAVKCSPESIQVAVTCPYGRWMIAQGVTQLESITDALAVTAGDSVYLHERLVHRGIDELAKRKPDTALTGQARQAAETILKGTVLPEKLTIQATYQGAGDYASVTQSDALTAYAQALESAEEADLVPDTDPQEASNDPPEQTT